MTSTGDEATATVVRTMRVDPGFSLAATCGPVAWVGERSPRHRWADGTLYWMGWERDRVVWRTARASASREIDIRGTGDPALDREWGRTVLGLDIALPHFDDPVIRGLAQRFPGLRPYCDGSLFEGIVTAIVGQSISVAAAAVTQAKLAALFGNAVVLGERTFMPIPSAAQLAGASADLIRRSGVTWRRAEAIKHAAGCQVRGELPSDEAARQAPDRAVQALMHLPLVGRWTAESAVLWGIGAPDAHPTGDVALLRAARAAYERSDMTLNELDALAEQWRPARGLAARLLWTGLFGPAPE